MKMGEDIMDYTDRCRLCIASSAKRLSIDIFSPEGKRSKLQSKISKYLSLKVSENDKLPSSMCYQCLFRLETWASFKKHCLDSDQTLKNWAFFCGAITPESYLIEANKSSENGSDVEKPTSSYFSSKDNVARPKHRTSRSDDKTGPGLSHTPPRSVSPGTWVPLSSSSSSSSQRRGSEAGERPASKAKESLLNGVTRAPSVRTSKAGRRKLLHPTKAFTTRRGDEHQIQLIKVERKVEESPPRKSEESKLPKELPQQLTSNLALPFKRKRGRPSKAWLRERAEALKKLKETAQRQQELSPEKERKEQNVQKELMELRELKESKDLKESRDVNETRDAKEPKDSKASRDFKVSRESKDSRDSMVSRDAKESRDSKVSRESKESRDSKESKDSKVSRDSKESRDSKVSRDSKELTHLKEQKDFKESRDLKDSREPSELRESKERKEPKLSKPKNMMEMIELDDPDFGSMKFTLSVIDSSAVPTSEKTALQPESSTSVSSGRLSSDSFFKEEFSGFSNAETKTAEEETSSKIVPDAVSDRLSEPCVNEISDMPLSPQKSDRKRSHSALGHRSYDEVEEKIKKLDATSRSLESLKGDDSTPIAITALSLRSPDQIKTDDESDGEIVTGDETNLGESYTQSDVDSKNEPPLEEDYDSDLVGPPMSPLSPARINFEVIELGEMRDNENDENEQYGF